MPDSREDMLHELQRDTFNYFRKEVNVNNGLIADSTQEHPVSSIAATGLGLSAYIVAAEQGFLTRVEARDLTLATLRFFCNSAQSTEPDATGYKGFYYHFLNMKTGRRAWKSELSTIDTTFLLAGMLAAATYFDKDTKAEFEIRERVDDLYLRVDWQWALHNGSLISHGWKPGRGFLKYRWSGYCEALLLYILALGSPTYPVPKKCYEAWSSSYTWKELYGTSFLFANALFIHQLSHIWVDFRGIQDDFMREKGIDYFENSRRATYIQQAHAQQNPSGFKGYGEYIWGFTASSGPGPATQTIDGKKRRFYGYKARGVPDPDDGTIAPWAAVASLPFAPEIVLPTLEHLEKINLGSVRQHKYGFKSTFNPTFRIDDSNAERDGTKMWVSPVHYGLNQGPILLMIENYRSELIWDLMKRNPYIRRGLNRAGFTGGWLEDDEATKK
ncbi:MAG TPA: glucoamylase family protein [Balneolaceae bacterium]|nr:glucoamylase family protein [Balneolaceae bacterium]